MKTILLATFLTLSAHIACHAEEAATKGGPATEADGTPAGADPKGSPPPAPDSRSGPAPTPDGVAGLIEAGKNLEKQGDQAREQLLKASEKRGSTNGLIDKEVHLYQQAIASYTKAIAVDPNNPEALQLRGLVFAKRDQDGKQSLVMQSKGGFPMVVGAVAKFGPEAIADLNHAILLAPEDSEAYYIRGKIYAMQFQNKWNVYSRLGPREKAVSDVRPDISLARNAAADLKKATTLNPQLGVAYEELGRLYFICYHVAESLENFRKAEENGVMPDKGLIDQLETAAKDPAKAGLTKAMLNEYPLP